MKPKHQISKEKINFTKELLKMIKGKKTILVASIKNIPASQFQEIGKKLRGKAIIKVPKKSLIFRALDDTGDEAVKKIKKQIGDSVAVLFSDLDSFDLALELTKNTTPAKAKTGQIAPEDIRVEAGPTDLPPGPAISELGNLGLQVQIEKGKISIKESRVIVKKGEKISQEAAEVMGKLDIKPFSVGFIPLASFDNQNKKLYLNIKIDKEGTIKELKKIYSRALPFAVEIGHISDDTIKFLIKKAVVNEKTLESLTGKCDVQELNKQEGE